MKSIKKTRIFSALLIMALIISTVITGNSNVLASSSAQMWLSNAVCNIGEEVTITLNLADNTGVMAIQPTIIYDKSKLEYVGSEYQATGLLGAVNPTPGGLGEIKIALGSIEPIKGGSILKLKFKAIAQGTAYVNFSTITAGGQGGKIIKLITANGSITINSKTTQPPTTTEQPTIITPAPVETAPTTPVQQSPSITAENPQTEISPAPSNNLPSFPITFEIEEGYGRGYGKITAMVENKPIKSGDLVEYGKSVVFTAHTDNGWFVAGWNGDGWAALYQELNTVYTIRVTEEVCVRARLTNDMQSLINSIQTDFIRTEHAVNFKANGNGNIKATVNDISVNSGDIVEWGKSIVLYATPAPGHYIAGWGCYNIIQEFTEGNSVFTTSLGGDTPLYVEVFFEPIISTSASLKKEKIIPSVNWYWGDRVDLMGWSVGTQLFNAPIANCVKFTLNYEFTEIKGGNPYGKQDIYIKISDTIWEKVGSLNAPNKNMVTVTIDLINPTNIKGIAVLPSKAPTEWADFNFYFAPQNFIVKYSD